MVAVVQKHFDPWHPRLLDKTEAQLDAILEAYSETFPRELKFERRRDGQSRERLQTLSAQWSDRLIGAGKEELKRKVSFRIPDHLRRVTQPRPTPGRK